MNSLYISETAFLYAALAMFVCVPLVRAIAVRVGLVDKPNHRKVHHTPVPLVGGLSIGISVALAVSLSASFDGHFRNNLPWIAGAVTMLAMGALDDRFNVSAFLRLGIQLVCAFAVAYSGIRITSLYGIFGIYELPIFIQYGLTMVAIAGVVNAVNLMDGIDGLLGGLALVACLLLGVLAYEESLPDLVVVLSAIAGSLVVFLRYNLGKKKIFMGDAGSVFLGFVLVVSSIRVLNATHGQPFHDQVEVLLIVTGIFLVPVLDSLRVYRGRIKKGSSPFKADKTHLHHLLLFIGVTHKQATVAVLALVLLIIGTVAGLLYFLPVTWVVILGMLLFSAATGFLSMRQSVNEWTVKIKRIEQGHN